MSKLTSEAETLTHPTVAWSSVLAIAFEDVAEGVIGFLPNGLDYLYDRVLKPMPVLGSLFTLHSVEQLFKLISGITIGKGIARDAARFVFNPLGFIIGFIIGSSYFAPMRRRPQYHRMSTQALRQIAGSVVGCALLGAGLCALAQYLLGQTWFPFPTASTYGIFALMGALIGLLIQWLVVYAVDIVRKNNAQSHQAIFTQAKALCKTVTSLARRQAKGRILMQAQDIIQQVNGPQSQQFLEQFFQEQFDIIAQHIYEKLDRHIHYVTDRACNGDMRAFKRLKELNFTGKSSQANISVLAQLLNKVFNPRTVLKLKDEVDTSFDKWMYRHSIGAGLPRY